jgi:hypothetical protein
MDKSNKQRERQNYANILDKPLGPKSRRMAITMLEATSAKEVAEGSGASMSSVYKAMENVGIAGASTHVMTEKLKDINKLSTMLTDMLDKEAETPLKHSDKIAAARLYAEIKGITGDNKGSSTVNIGILDLRSASESELLQELALLEEKKHSSIDAKVIDGDVV